MASVHTLIPFESSVESIFLLLFNKRSREKDQESLTERSGILEWLWDLSEFEFTKVVHDWFFRELHERISLLKSIKE